MTCSKCGTDNIIISTDGESYRCKRCKYQEYIYTDEEMWEGMRGDY